MSLRGPELELRVASRPDLQQRIVAAVVELEARDRLCVTAIEIFRQTKHRREPSDDFTSLSAELSEVGVVARGRRPPMVASHERNRFDFLRLETAQVAVLDQVVRVAVVTLATDMDARLVQERGVIEPLAVSVGHAVNGPRTIEPRRRQA